MISLLIHLFILNARVKHTNKSWTLKFIFQCTLLIYKRRYSLKNSCRIIFLFILYLFKPYPTADDSFWSMTGRKKLRKIKEPYVTR